MGRYLNESDQRATTVLNAILLWPRGPESIRLLKVTLRSSAAFLSVAFLSVYVFSDVRSRTPKLLLLRSQLLRALALSRFDVSIPSPISDPVWRCLPCEPRGV